MSERTVFELSVAIDESGSFVIYGDRRFVLGHGTAESSDQAYVAIYSDAVGPVPDEVLRFVDENRFALWATRQRMTDERLFRAFDWMQVEIDGLRARVHPSKKTVSKERSIAAKLRFSILERDGFRCRYCGATAQTAELRVDHVVPVSRGGKSTPENLVTACHPCNAGKFTSIAEVP